MITFSEDQIRRESYILGGWNLTDDDVPHRPEPDPMSSAQARRAWRQSTPTASAQREPHGR